MMIIWSLVSLLLLAAVVVIFDKKILPYNHIYYFYFFFLVVFLPIILSFLLIIFSTLSRKPSRRVISYFSISLMYLVVPMIFAIALHIYEISKDISGLLLLLATLWINDTMAYIFGSLIGKHKMIERISPGKTWEGFFGGLIFTMATILIINQIFFDLDMISLGIIVLVIVLSGTIGDLLESKLKREAGVKDSGTVIPGHGGVLDRIDSLLVAAPFTVVALIINNIITNLH